MAVGLTQAVTKASKVPPSVGLAPERGSQRAASCPEICSAHWGSPEPAVGALRSFAESF